MTAKTEQKIENAQRLILKATLEILQAECDFGLNDKQAYHLRRAGDDLNDIADKLGKMEYD